MPVSRVEEPDAVRLALARAQAARRVVGSELAAGCAERGSEKVLVLSSKKGCWLRTVPSSDNAALWLLDMIRRAACRSARRQRGRASSPPGQAAQNHVRNPGGGNECCQTGKPRRKHPLGRWPAGGAPAGWRWRLWAVGSGIATGGDGRLPAASGAARHRPCACPSGSLSGRPTSPSPAHRLI